MTSIHVPVQRIAAGSLKHLPETFDPAWLKSTWSGPHGRLGLHADISTVESRIQLTERSVAGKAGISGTIRTPDGTNVGELNRDVNFSENGRLNVYHAYLQIKPEVQKSGFASSFNNAAFDAYAAAGVDDVTVTAALDAGGYVWARTGFELAAKGATSADEAALKRATQLRTLVDRALEYGTITDDDYIKLYPRLLDTDGVLRSDTLTSVRELAAMDGIGERVLKGQSWSGIRLLDTPAPFAARGVGGAIDAQLGVAHLRASAEIPAAMTRARDGVDSLLPEAFSPAGFAGSVERATEDLSISLVRKPNNAVTELDIADHRLAAKNSFDVVGSDGEKLGKYTLGRTLKGDEIHATRSGAGEVPDSGQLNTRVRDLLRDQGVTRIAAAHPYGWSVGRSRPIQ